MRFVSSEASWVLAAGLVSFLLYRPAYEVYRGYIVFVFSITMFVCLYVCKQFSVKVFSETTMPRILSFSTNSEHHHENIPI